MNKERFCKCLEAMSKYSVWERDLYKCGFDLAYTPVTDVLDSLLLCMSDFNYEWAYDTREGLNWIIEWSFGETRYARRHGIEFILDTPSALYEFIVFMNEHGWDEREAI